MYIQFGRVLEGGLPEVLSAKSGLVVNACEVARTMVALEPLEVDAPIDRDAEGMAVNLSKQSKDMDVRMKILRKSEVDSPKCFAEMLAESSKILTKVGAKVIEGRREAHSAVASEMRSRAMARATPDSPPWTEAVPERGWQAFVEACRPTLLAIDLAGLERQLQESITALHNHQITPSAASNPRIPVYACGAPP